MSQPDNQDPERGNVTVDHPNQHLFARIENQPSKRQSNLGDGSAPLFTMYSKIAEEKDKEMVEQWQQDAKGIIIFNGLFSAVVAALVAVSVQDLRPNSQDTSAFYLEKMYQLQADPNVSRSSTVAQPPAFSPPTYAIWVNSLWFLSLVISLSCAMLATSLQQWARRYLRCTQLALARCSPPKRARVRTFFANGVERLGVAWVVEALPALVHVSLFIFFAGLVIYLFNINHTVFSAAACWIGLLSTVYLCITLMPCFLHDSPYYSPLSSIARLLCTPIFLVVCVIPAPFTCCFGSNVFDRYFALAKVFMRWFIDGVGGDAGNAAFEGSSEIDGHIVEWTLDALIEDDELEEFTEAIPGFYKSDIVNDLQQEPVRWKILGTMHEFLDRTFSADSVSTSVKIHRLTTCLNAAGVVDTSKGVDDLLSRLFFGNWHGMPDSVEIGHFLTSWIKSNNVQSSSSALRSLNAHIVSSVRERDDRWMALAMECLGLEEGVLQDYLAHGDSVLLACLILFRRHAHHPDHHLTSELVEFCQFDIHNTLPGLQRDFCLLWNEVLQDIRNDKGNDDTFSFFVSSCRLYVALHQDTDAASIASFDSTNFLFKTLVLDWPLPILCKNPDHRSDSTPDIHSHPASHASTTSIAVPRRDPLLASVLPSSSPSSHLDDTTPQPPDEPSPVSESFTPVSQVLPPDSTTSPGSLVIPSAQTTADHPPPP
ncbi:hypothetical protein BJV74DRAFT_454579 [Russula compacta]|nr:hypothetical protein BJV74DRAFT_454579 [Russula compacta]